MEDAFPLQAVSPCALKSELDSFGLIDIREVLSSLVFFFSRTRFFPASSTYRRGPFLSVTS